MKNIQNKKFYLDTGLTSNMEDYMEAIIMLEENSRVVRVKDIAAKLNIKMPSVTAALNKLKEMDLIKYEKYGHVELTAKGKIIADSIYHRHSCLKEYYCRVLQLDIETAEHEACKVEHDLSPETLCRIDRLVNFYTQEERNNAQWIKRLKKALKD